MCCASPHKCPTSPPPLPCQRAFHKDGPRILKNIQTFAKAGVERLIFLAPEGTIADPGVESDEVGPTSCAVVPIQKSHGAVLAAAEANERAIVAVGQCRHATTRVLGPLCSLGMYQGGCEVRPPPPPLCFPFIRTGLH